MALFFHGAAVYGEGAGFAVSPGTPRADEPTNETMSLPGNSKSESSDKQSSLSSELKVDTTNTTDFDIDADFVTKKGTHFILGYERVASPATTSQPEDLDTNEGRVGVGGDLSDSFDYRFNFAIWGEKNVIGSDTFSLSMDYLPENWIFSAEPGIRFIGVVIQNDSLLKAIEGPNSPNSVIISDPNITLGADYLGLDPWHFKISSAYFAYSRGMAALSSQALTKFFSESALNLANSFNEFELTPEIGYAFKIVSLSLEYSYAVSEIDFSSSYSLTLKMTFYFFKDFDTELEAGQSPSIVAGQPSVNFAGLGLDYYW